MFLNYVYIGLLVTAILCAIHPPFRQTLVEIYEVGSAKFGIIPAVVAVVLVFGMMVLVWPLPAFIYLKERVS